MRANAKFRHCFIKLYKPMVADIITELIDQLLNSSN